MASVLDWLPQLAGADWTRAGCPGSNGSTMGTNDAAADALPVAACAAELLAAVSTGTGMLLAGEEELLQPAAKPARRASIAACATRRPRPSVIIPQAPCRRFPP